MTSSDDMSGRKGTGQPPSVFDEKGPSLADFLPDTSGGYTAYAGVKRPDHAAGGAVAEQAVIEAVMTVRDPEIPVNIYDLGLIYDIIRHDNGDVDVTMSLTAPGCPVAGEMPQQVANAIAGIDLCGLISVSLVWDPPWSPERMSEDAKMALDFGF